MRVNSVGQQNNPNGKNAVKAAAVGAIGGALVRSFAPLTTDEHAFFFNENARNAIKEKVKNVRANEVTRIAEDFAASKLNISKEAYDVFEKSSQTVIEEPKKALDLVQNSTEAIKKGVKSLVQRVDAVGIAKQHTEVSNIKSAAKSSRPLAYFAAAGALIAMTGQLLVDAFNNLSDGEDVQKQKSAEPLTMADVLLAGLGSNTEILFLSQEANKK